jgi:butyryl-CoA dehydrogenase
MFRMMNEARIVVGLSSTMLGIAGYRYSLEYARNRLQGRPATRKGANSSPIPIIEHADVRRMLLIQRSYVEAGYALGLYGALLVDCQKNDLDPTAREQSRLLLEFLTPVLKSASSEYALQANDLAIQVLGGYGYTRDYPVEQYWRDNRLNPIHEGTNGIQAIDLLGRKAQMADGAARALFLEAVGKSIRDASAVPELRGHAETLQIALADLEGLSANLVGAIERAGIEKVLANAKPYLDIVGIVMFAWMWLRQALAASHRLAGCAAETQLFYRGKLQACKYFFQWEVPKVSILTNAVNKLESSWLEMDPEWF